MFKPGEYEVGVVTGIMRSARVWKGGHKTKLTVAGQTLRRAIRKDEVIDTARTKYFPEYITRFGKVTFKEPGTYELQLKAEEIKKSPGGLTVASVLLTPAK